MMAATRALRIGDVLPPLPAPPVLAATVVANPAARHWRIARLALAEDQAARLIARAGLHVWFPVTRKTERVGRGRARIRGAVDGPLWPGYLFIDVANDAAMHAMLRLTSPGGRRVVREFLGNARVVPVSEVEALRKAVGEGRFDRKAVRRRSLVRLTAPMFEDRLATVHDVMGDELKVMISMLGGERAVTVARGDVEVVAVCPDCQNWSCPSCRDVIAREGGDSEGTSE